MRFEKVSKEQYLKDCMKDIFYDSLGEYRVFEDTFRNDSRVTKRDLSEIYENIKLPRRATKKSAGYDFFTPYGFQLNPGETIKIATGIRVILDDDKFLMCAPRSSLGFKYRLQLDNTVAIIDADYSDSDNEGHIMLKLTNDSNMSKEMRVEAGEAILQGIIMKYYVVEDDDTSAVRNGGIGSTNKL